MAHKIEWLNRPGTTGATWNPVTGCTKISTGCKNCYAARMAKRMAGRFGYPEDDPFRVTLHPDKLDVPLKWRKPRTVFVCSMSDFFHPAIPFAFQRGILQVIGKCPQHTFLILTKRTDQLEMWEYAAGWHPYPNLWLGVTVENQEQADKRIPALLQIPAAVRFVSVEPMLEQIDLFDVLAGNSLYKAAHYAGRGNYHGEQQADKSIIAVCNDGTVFCDGVDLDWIICGAETGSGARPMQLDWAFDLRDQCRVAGVPLFFKRASPGIETPPGLAIREWPEV